MVNEERTLPACDNTTYVLESAIRYQLVEGFSPSATHEHQGQCYRRRSSCHTHHELVRWSQRAEGLYQTLTVGESATLDNVGVFTLIDILPLSRDRRWSTPVVCFQQDPSSSTLRVPTPPATASSSPATRNTAGAERFRRREDRRSDDSSSEKADVPPVRSSARTNCVKLLTTTPRADSLGCVNYRFAQKQTPTNGS